MSDLNVKYPGKCIKYDNQSNGVRHFPGKCVIYDEVNGGDTTLDDTMVEEDDDGLPVKHNQHVVEGVEVNGDLLQLKHNRYDDRGGGGEEDDEEEERNKRNPEHSVSCDQKEDDNKSKDHSNNTHIVEHIILNPIKSKKSISKQSWLIFFIFILHIFMRIYAYMQIGIFY